MSELWSALIISLRVSICATIATTLIAVPLAYYLARRRFVGRTALETLLTLPLVLPPTVVGYLLILFFGVRGPGGWLLQHLFGVRLILSEAGAVVAATVVSLPLLFLPAKSAIAGVDPELEEIGRLMGASRWQIFWHVSLPLARRGIASGLLLAFARALGEFGATVMVLGDISGHRTLPISIYNDFLSGEGSAAFPAVILLCLTSLAVIWFYNKSSAH
jgi:molybdate transport system permease protein